MKNNVKLCGKKKTAGLKYKLYSDYWIATWSREDLCIKVTVVILLVYKEWLYTLGDNIFLNDHFDVVWRNICCHHRVTDSPTIGGTKKAKTEPTPTCFLVQTGLKILNTAVHCFHRLLSKAAKPTSLGKENQLWSTTWHSNHISSFLSEQLKTHLHPTGNVLEYIDNKQFKPYSHINITR